MYAFLKDNLCVGVHDLPVDEALLAENEKQIELKNTDVPLNVLGKTYIQGEFVEAEKSDQEKRQEIIAANQQFLKETDWKIIRHRDQLDMGIQTSLTDEDYKELLVARQMAREEC